MRQIRYLFFFTPLVVVFALPLVSRLQTRNPHGAIQMECSQCHTSESWKVNPTQMPFHHELTGFPLLGEHRRMNCFGCHKNLQFARIGISCADCHSDIHRGQLGVECQRCHTPENWENHRKIFLLHSQTHFPLIGVHATTDCEACHFTQQRTEFANTPIECRHCHLENFQRSRNPDHQKAGFSTECLTCHPPLSLSWNLSSYQHPAIFSLQGAHQQTTCTDCHQQRYTGTPATCYGCHEQNYQQATEPNHVQFGFFTQCERCHDESAWEPARFDHRETSGFPLQEAHARLRCTSCHVNNQISGLPRECFGCHEQAYRGAVDPNHSTAGFNHDCTICHTARSWRPSTFDHNRSGFVLTGAHVTAECDRCHGNGEFAGTPKDCWSCHTGNFQSVKNPDHVSGNFDHDCSTCHTTQAWKPASFDHSKTRFPLTGAHSTLECSGCHASGYSGTPGDCYSCHEQNYRNTTNPNHSAALFPPQCEQCHNTSDWRPANWDHDNTYFPIYSGEHEGKWNTCKDCHVDLNNYTIFECINCHEHEKTKMDDKHKEVNNYRFLSTACYNCHPKGKE